MKYLLTLLSVLSFLVYVRCQDKTNGASYIMVGYNNEAKIVKMMTCDDTHTCYKAFKNIKHKTDVVYVYFATDDIENCTFNETINDNITYLTFCVNNTLANRDNIIANTIHVINGFTKSVNYQCENLKRYNSDVFLIYN